MTVRGVRAQKSVLSLVHDSARKPAVSAAPKETTAVQAQAPGQTQAPAPAPLVLREVIIDGCAYLLIPRDASPLEVSAADGGAETPAGLLTDREIQIARLVADGLVNKEIGVKLRISEWTVSTHLRRIFVKLGVDTRAAMVSRCFGR